MRENCSTSMPDGSRAHWWTENLWAASAGLPVEEVPIDDVAEFDRDCWFRGRAPSVREVARHARRINDADLSYPIILAADGTLLDGGHRLARAWLEGRTTIRAVRFVVDPPPDWVSS